MADNVGMFLNKSVLKTFKARNPTYSYLFDEKSIFALVTDLEIKIYEHGTSDCFPMGGAMTSQQTKNKYSVKVKGTEAADYHHKFQHAGLCILYT